MIQILKRNKLLKKIFGFSLASWISALLNFSILPISTRYFEPVELGKINLFLIILTIILPIVSLGLDQGYIRFFHEQKNEQEKKNLLSICLIVGIIILSLLIVILIPFQDFISMWLLNETGKHILILLFICTLNILILRYMSLFHRMNDSIILFTITSIASLPLLKVSFLIGAIYNSNYYTVILIMTCISFCTLLITIAIHKRNVNIIVPVKKNLSLKLLSFSLPLMPVSAITLLNNNIPLFLLQGNNELKQVGLYSTAITLAGIITLLQSGLNIFWSPYVFKHYKNANELESIRNIHRLIVYVMVVLALFIIMLQDLIVLLIGEDFRGILKFLPLLLILPVSYTIAETTGIGIAIAKKSRLNLIIVVVSLLVNIVLCYILVPLYSVIGAAVSSAISSLIMLILKTIFGQKYFRSVQRYRYLVVGMVTLLLIAGVTIIYYENTIICFSLNIIGLVGLSVFFNLKKIIQGVLKKT